MKQKRISEEKQDTEDIENENLRLKIEIVVIAIVWNLVQHISRLLGTVGRSRTSAL